MARVGSKDTCTEYGVRSLVIVGTNNQASTVNRSNHATGAPSLGRHRMDVSRPQEIELNRVTEADR